MRILVALAPQMYGEVLADTLSESRPACEVLRVAPEELDGELEHLLPGLVICNEATDEVQEQVPTWIALFYADDINATVCVSGHLSTIEGVVIEDVLEVVDEAEQGCG